MLAGGMVYFLRVAVSLLFGAVVGPFVVASPHRGASPLVRFLAAATIGCLYWTAMGFFLGAMHVLELAPLLVVTVVAAILVQRRRRIVPDPKASRGKEASMALDAMDPSSPGSFVTIALSSARLVGGAIWRAVRRLGDPITLIAVAATLYILVRTLAGPLGQVSPGTADGYNSLVSAKELAIGLGAFQGGIFPEGMQALVATMSTLFFTDALNILRFMGALGGLFLALSAGALTDELTRSRTAGVLAFILIGLTTAAGVGAPNWLLTVPLVVKWAAAFTVVGVTFGIRHYRERARRDLWVMGMATLVASLIEPRTAFLVPLAMLALSLGHLVRPSPHGSTWRPVVYALAAEAIGVAPLAIAHFLGAPWSLYMWSVAQPPIALTGPILFLFRPAGQEDAAILAVVVMMASFLAAKTATWRAPVLFGLGLTVVFTVGLAHLLAPLPYDVQDVVTAGGLIGILLVPLAVGWLLGGVVQEGHHVGAERLLALIVAATCYFALPLAPVKLQHYEPIGSGRVYLSITERFPAYTWTIISPTTQYSEVLGHGWHVELYDLLVDDPVNFAASPSFRLRNVTKLPIQTSDSFLYVYLHPFGLTRPFLPSDFSSPLPPATANVYAGTDGAIVEAHALAWAKAYLKAHPKTSSIYFRNRDLMVLWIRQ